MKNLIGRKIKGFKFEDVIIPFHHLYMDNHIGEIGTITHVRRSYCRVQFENGFCYYPTDQIEQHLIDEKKRL